MGFLRSFGWLLIANIAAIHGTAAPCDYKTVAGWPVTFRGENQPVERALFNQPSAIASGKDGAIYIADTGNNRIRVIDSGGTVRTVAGTGEAAFGGDGEAATRAALQQPSGVAIGPDGSIFIADTGNHRVRKVSPDGVITTVAGDGHARFNTESGPALAVSLNTPTQLQADGAGNVYVLDSQNSRVRRITPGGFMTTVAGASPRADYSTILIVEEPEPLATEAASLSPISFSVGPDGVLYIVEMNGISRVGGDGVLRRWITFAAAAEAKVDAPVPVNELQILWGSTTVGADGTVYIEAATQLLAVSNGLARRISDSFSAASLAIAGSGDFLGFDASWRIVRLRSTGERVTIWSAPDSSYPRPALEGALNRAGGVAAAPDGTIYVAETGTNRILAIDRAGQIRVFAGTEPGRGVHTDGSPALSTELAGPRWLTLDSKGTLYFSEPGRRRIRKIGSDGLVQTFVQTPEAAMAIGTDAQDRLYVFSGRDRFSQVIRYARDGTPTVLMSDIAGGAFFWGGVDAQRLIPGMAIARDGTVYVMITTRLANNESTIYKIAPDGTRSLIPMEQRWYPSALALGSDGALYGASAGVIKKINADGSMVTIHSAAEPSPTQDLAFDREGGLLATDGSAVRRINLQCDTTPGPSISSVLESATGNAQLRVAPGQLITIYGVRLGPERGGIPAPDGNGFYPTQVSGTRVLVNGVEAPLLYVGANQINAVVPFEVDEQTTGTVQVMRNGAISDSFHVSLGRWAPALFSIAVPPAFDRYVLMLNEDGSVNGPQRPAKLGSVVTVFATGLGITSPTGESGKVGGLALKRPVRPAAVTVGVGGREAEVLYQGTAPGLVEGVMQINLRLPSTLPGRGGNLEYIGIGTNDGVPQPVRLFFYFEE